MYVLGFVLIFIGLALMLYFFVLRFADRSSSRGAAAPSASPPLVKAEPSYPVEQAPPAVAEATTVVQPAAPAGRTEPVQAEPEKTETRTPAAAEPQPTGELKELYTTGYLYTDAAHSTVLLDSPEKVEAESTGHMKRLGPASLRFRHEAYCFDHGDGTLVLPESRMREIRFSDGGAVFVPQGSDLPLAYFFTVETQAIREFLSSRS